MNVISRVERQRGIEEERVEPDTVEGDGPEAAISFVGKVCARAATSGKRSMKSSMSVERGSTAGGFPSLAASLSDRD